MKKPEIKAMTPSERARIISSKRLETIVQKVIDAFGFQALLTMPHPSEKEIYVEMIGYGNGPGELEAVFDGLIARGLEVEVDVWMNGNRSALIKL
jgi:hypothetical protein